MAMSKYRWIYTTWPDAGLAGAAGRTLVQEGLCACVNILPGMILKTSSEKAPAVIDRLVALHPYDEPCAVGLDIDAAASAPGFLTWMGAALSAGA